jgi:hypothetical protein
MHKLDISVERERKRSSGGREKAIRLTILFCVIAAVTALIIYLIVPESEANPPVEAETSIPGESVDNREGAEREADTAAEKDGKAVDKKAEADKKTGGSDNEAADEDPGVSGGNGESENPVTPEKEVVAEKHNNAKYDPTVRELFNHTAKFPAMLKDGSWKKSGFAVSHVVAPNEYASTLARKYHNNLDFVRVGNDLDEKYTIGLNQTIYFLRADSWQIVISRKNGTLQLNRVVNNEKIPFAVFDCKIKNDGRKYDDLVICSRQRKPAYNASHGRRFKSGDPENPYGEFLLAVAFAKNPGAPVYYLSIHDCKDEKSESIPLKNGATILNHEDISLLYMLAPVGTAVRIVE